MKNDKCFKEPVSVLLFLTTDIHFPYIILKTFRICMLFFSVFLLRLQVTSLLTFPEIENDYCEMSILTERKS